jgi:hypothetical protein
MRDAKSFYAKLEAAGEESVRNSLAQGIYGTENRPLVAEWLHQKDAEREGTNKARVDGREQKRVDLAQEANEIARSSAKIARAAHRLSILSAFVALVAVFIAALAYLAKA